MIVMMVEKGAPVGDRSFPSLFGSGVGLISVISRFLMGRQAKEFWENADRKKSAKGFEKGTNPKLNNGRTGGEGDKQGWKHGNDVENPGVEASDNKIYRNIVLHKAWGTYSKVPNTILLQVLLF